MIILQVIFTLLFMCLGIFCFISLISFIRTSFHFKTLDELEKKAIYESLAISFIVVMAIHFIQLIGSLFMHEPFSVVSQFIISPGLYGGSLIGNAPLHFDSFLMDNGILGIVYFIRRKKYGLI